MRWSLAAGGDCDGSDDGVGQTANERNALGYKKYCDYKNNETGK